MRSKQAISLIQGKIRKRKRHLKKKKKMPKMRIKTVINLGRKLTNAEVTKSMKEGLSMKRETRSGDSSNKNTTETSRSRSESRTKSSQLRATGRPMRNKRERKSASDRRKSNNATLRSRKSTSIS